MNSVFSTAAFIYHLTLRFDFYRGRQAGAGGWSWNGVREKYYWTGWSWSNVRGKNCSAGGLETSRTQCFLFATHSPEILATEIERLLLLDT